MKEAISQASASMLTEVVMNKPLISITNLSKDDVYKNIGLKKLGPARVKCALLQLKVLKLGMVQYYAAKDPKLAENLQNEPSLGF